MINYNNPDVRYMTDVQYMPDVKYMSDVRYMPDVKYMPDVQYGPTKGVYLKTPYSSEEDETTKINTLVDVIWPWATDARERLTMDTPWLEWYNEYSPILGDAKNITDYLISPVVIFYNNVIDPFTKLNKDFTIWDAGKELAFNTLNELGEDADILSNIVKSQMSSAGGDPGLDTLAQSVGAGGPRKKFNYNTGNTVLDVVLETISDPITWATIIIGAISGSAKAAATSATKGVIAETGANLSDDATDEIAKLIVNELNEKDVGKIADKVAEKISQRTQQEIVDSALEKTAKQLVKEATEKVLLTEGYQTFKTTTAALNAIESVEKVWATASQWMTPIGPIKLATNSVVELIVAHYNKITEKLKSVKEAQDFVEHKGTYTKLASDAIAVNNAMQKTLFNDNLNTFFRPIHMTPTEVQTEIINMLQTVTDFNNFDLIQEFKVWLRGHNKGFNVAMRNADFKAFVNSKEFINLVENLATAPIAIRTAELVNKNAMRDSAVYTLKKYIQKHGKTLEEVYRYVDKELLNYNGIHYGLDNVDIYLKTLAVSNVPRDYLVRVSRLLENLGINTTNAPYINKILNSTIKDKNKAIVKVLEKTKNLKLLENDKYFKTINKIENQINESMNSQLTALFKDVIGKRNKEYYDEILDPPIKNMKQAVNNIKNDVDVQHATTYIQQMMRADPNLPEQSNVVTQLQNVLLTNPILKNKYVNSKTGKIEIIESLQTFFKNTDRILSQLDDNTKVASEIPAWWDNLDNTIKLVNNVQKDLLAHGGPDAVKVRRELSSLQKTLKTFTKKYFKDNVVNYTESINDSVFVLLSHYGMLNVLEQHTYLSNNPDIKFALNLLSDKNSVYRQKAMELIKFYEDNNMFNHSQNLKKVIAQIDTVTNIMELQATDLAFSFKLNNKTQKSLKNILYDEIENHRYWLISDILKEDKQDIVENVYKYYKDFKLQNTKESYRTLLQKSIEHRIDITPTLRDSIMKQIKEQGLNLKYEDVKKEITEQLNKLLDDYITEQAKIGDALDIKDIISLSSLYSSETVNTIKQITNAASRFDLASAKNFEPEMLSIYDSLTYDLKQLEKGIQFGIDDIARINDEIQYPIKYQEATALLQQRFEEYNLYSASIETNMFTTKYIASTSWDEGYIEDIYKLSLDDVNGTPAEYGMLTNKLKSYHNIKFEDYKYEPSYINNLKEALIVTYSRPDVMFGPKNPTEYFNKLGPQALLGWEALSTSSFNNNNSIAFAINSRKFLRHQQYRNHYTKADQLAKMDAIMRNTPFTNDEDIATMASIARDANTLEYGTLLLSSNFELGLHDLEDLGKNEKIISKLLKNDAKTLKSVTEDIIRIEDIAILRTEFENSSNVDFIIEQINKKYPNTKSSNKYLKTLLELDLEDVSSIEHTVKTLEELEFNDDMITKILANPLAAYPKTVAEDKQLMNLIKGVRKPTFSNIQDLADFSNSAYGYELGLDKPLIQAYAERASNRALDIASMDAEELATFIYKHNPGILVFRNDNIVLTKNLDGSMSFEPIANPFKFTEEELKQAGLKMKKVQEDGVDVYLFRLIDKREHNKAHTYRSLATANLEVQENITNLIEEYRDKLNLNVEDDVPSNLITVEILNKDTLAEYIKKYEDFFGDFEEQKLYQNFNVDGTNSFFNKSYERLNFTVIGGHDTYNVWNSANSKTFMPRSELLTRNTLSGLTSLIARQNKINKYLTLCFNNDWSLDKSPLLNKLFSEASDEEIKNFFNKYGYKVVVLKEDSKGLPKVFDMYVSNRTSLDAAAKAGGILVPRETYSALKKVINNREMTNDLLSIYRRVVPSTYKTMYLFTAGFLFRNSLDTLLYKNMNELGGISSLPQVLKYEFQAAKALRLHNKIQQEVLDLTENTTFGMEKLYEVLKKHTKEEVEVYMLTDLFVNSSASGGYSKALSNFMENYNKLHTEDIRPLWEQFYEDKVLFGEQPWNPLYWTRDLNNHIEQTGRFGLFLASVDAGIPVNDAINRVIKTHFDYDSLPDLMEICENIFWFSTFPINNFNYYLNKGLEKSPTLYKFLLDTQTASWNNGEYTYEELKKTKFLSYHALVGNFRLGKYVIKTNPSVFDFLGLVLQPISNVKERVNPFIASALGLVSREDLLEELNPAQTQLRNIAKIIKAANNEPDGSWIPSIYSKINDYDYIRSAGRWRNVRDKYKSSYNSYPKIKKLRAYPTYVRKYFAKRYRTDVRQNMRTNLRFRDAKFYRISNRGPSYAEPAYRT